MVVVALEEEVEVLAKNSLKNLIFSKELNIVIVFHIIILTIFFLYRLIFSTVYIESPLDNSFSLYLNLFLTSIRIDLIISSYLSLPILFTIFLPYSEYYLTKYLKIIYFYIGFVIFGLIVFLTINIEWFREFNNHLNIMFLKYGGAGKEGWLLVLEEYNLILNGLSWIVSSILIFYFFKRLVIINDQISFIKRIITFFISLILTIIFVRGGVQQRPLDWGYANFCKINLLNETAQNPLFYFGRSLIEMNSESEFDDFLYSENKDKLNKDYLELRKINSNHSLFINENIENPNIIIIILESYVSENCNFLNPNLNEYITPFLSSLADKSISFTNCFANGIRSAYGISSILTSYPVLPGLPLISQVESSNPNSIIHKPMNILSDLGYKRTFIYGGDSNFDNLKGFCVANGYDKVIDWNHPDLNDDYDGTMWGYYDHLMIDEVIKEADKNQENPFLITFFTTTNHDPFKVPIEYDKQFNNITTGKKKYQRARRTMAYNDHVLESFFKKIKDKSWYENTIFVITADHGLTVHRDIPNHPRNGHIPFIIFSDLIKTPFEIDKFVSQIDILPTLFDIMNKDDYLNSFYGISGIKNGLGFACRIFNHNLQWITKGNVYYERMGDSFGKHINFNNIWDDLNTNSANLDGKIFKQISNDYIRNAYYRFKQSNEY